jgi:enoyl-[acyl-carrier-protein] reductase (NADH)
LVVPWVRLTDRGRVTEAKEILKVLRRAASDDGFIARLTEQGSKALREYNLSRKAKAALMSGDIRWVEDRVGKLNARLRTWFDCRLQQEVW